MSKVLCHPSCITAGTNQQLNLKKLRKKIISGAILVCPVGLEECNNEFEKSQIQTLEKTYATKICQDSLHLGGLIRKEYNNSTGERIRYQEKRYFEYFGLANFEECELVIKQPSAIIRLQFDKLAKHANVTLVSLSEFIALVNK